jgi:hypothetical protein
MTTWRDLCDQLTTRQMAQLAANEGFGICDESLLLMHLRHVHVVWPPPWPRQA